MKASVVMVEATGAGARLVVAGFAPGVGSAAAAAAAAHGAAEAAEWTNPAAPSAGDETGARDALAWMPFDFDAAAPGGVAPSPGSRRRLAAGGRRTRGRGESCRSITVANSVFFCSRLRQHVEMKNHIIPHQAVDKNNDCHFSCNTCLFATTDTALYVHRGLFVQTTHVTNTASLR